MKMYFPEKGRFILEELTFFREIIFGEMKKDAFVARGVEGEWG